MKQILLTAILAPAVLISFFPAVASASSQSFYALNNTAQTGMLVTLTTNPQVVAPAVSQNAKSLVGVVAAPDEAAVDQQPGQISVREDGVAQALVSTEGGNVAVGDRIGPSDIAGVGAKLSGSGWIVGTAQAPLSPSTPGVIKITTKNHGTAYAATIPVNVKVIYYTAPATDVLQSIRNAVDNIVGRQVSIVALLLSFALVLAGLYLAGVIIKNAIQSGLLAISRQPLAKRAIGGRIIQSFGIALLVIIAMLAASYLLLRI